MILSASRRTDIPALYMDWFMNRLNEGYALVPNPLNPSAVSRVSLHPDIMDCIVFWSKNPAPLLSRIPDLAAYPFYVHFALNPYDTDMEPRLSNKTDLLTTFRRLSDRIGPHRVIWRYDTVLLSKRYTLDFHRDAFSGLAESLSGYTEKCVFSFLDDYAKIRNRLSETGARAPDAGEMDDLARRFAEATGESHIALETCAEAVDLDAYGIGHGRCIDDRLISRLTGKPIRAGKDANQRPACGCAASVDIGMYNTCIHGCRYCYANGGDARAEANYAGHDPASPLLCGSLSADAVVTERKR